MDTPYGSKGTGGNPPTSQPPPDGPATLARTRSPWGDLIQSLPTYEARIQFTDSLGPHEHALTAATSIGSSPSAPIRIADPTVSRLHVELTPSPEGLRAVDLDSRNGLFYDGRRFRDLTLRDGDRFLVGSTEVLVRLLPVTGETYLWPSTSFARLLARSTVMRDLFVRLAKVARTDSTVLIHGESGTGKELVAEAIHEHSSRAQEPFVVVDCGAFNEELIESQLFGHKRGAFTGATSDRLGAFQEADGGTLFLDEIAEMPLSTQPKLLRAIQERQVRPLGATEYTPVNVRFVSASHRDLRQMVNQGAFREDLYFRLAVLPIELPALRDRAEDIPMLVQHFLPESMKADVLDPAIAERLMSMPWLGNVRELKNFIELVVALGWADAFATRSEGAAPRGTIETVARSVADGVIPEALVRGDLRVARDAASDWWEREYMRAGLARHGGDVKLLSAEAAIGVRHLFRLKTKHRM